MTIINKQKRKGERVRAGLFSYLHQVKQKGEIKREKETEQVRTLGRCYIEDKRYREQKERNSIEEGQEGKGIAWRSRFRRKTMEWAKAGETKQLYFFNQILCGECIFRNRVPGGFY